MVKRSQKLFEGGKWAIIGGFVERDEKLEETVRREVKEEGGYEVKSLTLFSITDEPNRPGEDRQNIAFTFIAEAGEKISEPDWESTEQKWFSLSALPPKEEIAFDHYQTLMLYVNRDKNKTIPVII